MRPAHRASRRTSVCPACALPAGGTLTSRSGGPMSPQGTCPFTHPRSLFQDLATARAADGLPYAEAFGARVVSRYDEIVAALHGPGTFSSFATVGDALPFREMFAGRVPPAARC